VVGLGCGWTGLRYDWAAFELCCVCLGCGKAGLRYSCAAILLGCDTAAVPLGSG